jgi:GT2 family glycosyltransferase
VIVSSRMSPGAAAGAAFALSEQAVGGAALQLGIATTTLDGRRFWDSSGKDIAHDAVVLFIQEGDIVDEPGLEALWRAFGVKVRLCVFDTFHTVDDITYPVLQPGANLEHLRSIDCTFSRFAICGELLEHVLSSRKTYDERSILLGALDMIANESDWDAFIHCPAPVLRTPDLQADIKLMREDSIRDCPATPENAGTRGVTGTVSVIICTKDKGQLLDQLVRRLFQDCGPLLADVVIVSNQTTNAFAERTLRHWAKQPKVKVIAYDKPFNFSDQSNLGAHESQGALLLFLNDDIVPVASNWLSVLAAPFADPNVGIAGPLLLYPNETVQHAGMYLGFGGTAGHALRSAHVPENDYLFMATSARDVSCVTGAALLIRRACFEDLNGFDLQLVTMLQDVDLCLRVANLGYRILYLPRAVLLHMESLSIKGMLNQRGIPEMREREHDYFFNRHGRKRLKSDRYLSPNHHVTDETLRSLSY